MLIELKELVVGKGWYWCEVVVVDDD